MNLKWTTVAILALLVCIFVAWINSRDNKDTELANKLAERLKTANDGASEIDAAENASSWNLDELTSKQRGMPIPDGFAVNKVKGEGYWFVGKNEDGGGVEIPFAPGRFPTPPYAGPPKQENPGFVGADACKSCHPKNHESFVHTSHHLTTQLVTKATIEGQFDTDENRMETADTNVSMEMIERDGTYLQRVSFFDWKFDVPMQIIFGSAKMAQTYAYWHDDGLYQLNVTHLTDGDKWINSPGYIDGDAAYARPIPERCLDCHTTYFDFRESPNHFTPDSLILGVTCERCHGPGAEHIEHHQLHPELKTAEKIVLPSTLPRQRQLEICGQCHSGSTSLSGPALRYRPGDTLSDFYHPADESQDDLGSVHTSNQLTRLAQSKCFQGSEMTCIDCHDPHQSERGMLALFSERCLKCHTDNHSEIPNVNADSLAKNCIDCHMPIRPTSDLKLQSIEGDVFPPLRDHLIRIDAKATSEFAEKP